MTFVTVFRQVPKPITGMIGILYDREFEQFEANLDWLETTGVLVERFDLSQAPQEVANRPAVQQILVREADRCFATDTGERVGGVARHLLVPCRWLGPWVKP
jgi:hypothetical protein